MFNPFSQYSVMRNSGMSVIYSAFFVLICIIIMPYMIYKDWEYDRLPEEQKGFGKFRERTFDQLKAERDMHNIVRKK
jgi:hypothetical protein